MNRTALLSVWLVVVFTWLAPVPAHATTRQTLPEAAGTMGEPAHVIANQTDPLQLDAKTVNIELVLDSSASMSERLPEGETRMEAAQRILRQAIDDLPEREGINVGLRVYGHVGDNTEAGRALSCRSSELVVPVSGLDKAALIAQVEAMQPTGWTPIAYSLEQAAADFQPGGESITNAIVLVTDGEESCDPPQQSCAAAAALHQANVSVVTHVVGFALTPEQTELVRCVAEEGGGQLFGAENAGELGQALTEAFAEVGVPPATPVTVQGDVPPVFLGMWQGIATDASGGEQVALELDLSGGDLAAPVGTYFYPAAECGGAVTLEQVETEGSRVTLTERFGFSSTLAGLPPCPAGTDATITLAQAGEGTLEYTWTDSASGRSRSATLTYQDDYGRFVRTLSAVAGTAPLAGPGSGTLVAACCDDTVAGAGVTVTDFVASATFVAPVDPAINPMGVGLTFRRTPEMVERLRIGWDGTWNYWPSPQGNVRAGDVRTAWGTGLPFAGTPGSALRVDLVVSGQTALFGINGLYVATIELLHPVTAADVEVAELWSSGSVDGTEVAYTDFAVWALPALPSVDPTTVTPVAEPTTPVPEPVTPVSEPVTLVPSEPVTPVPQPVTPVTEPVTPVSPAELETPVPEPCPCPELATTLTALEERVAALEATVTAQATQIAALEERAGGSAPATLTPVPADGEEPQPATETLVPESVTPVPEADDAARFAAALVAQAGRAGTELDRLAGPLSGELVLTCCENATAGAGVAVAEFVASATFITPAQPEGNPLGVGIAFRDSPGLVEAIAIGWDGSWHYWPVPEGNVRAGVIQTATGGEIPFDPTPGSTNIFTLVVVGETALFAINGSYVATVELLHPVVAGDVEVVAYWSAGSADGVAVTFSDFQVWDFSSQSLPQVQPADPSLTALLPTTENMPAGFSLAVEGARTRQDLVNALGGTAEATRLLDEWGWSGGAFRDFAVSDGSASPSGTVYISVTISRFADAESAASAVEYFSDYVIAHEPLQEDQPPGFGDRARLLVGEIDGLPVSLLYLQRGPNLYRLGALSNSAEGNPTADVLTIAGDVLQASAPGEPATPTPTDGAESYEGQEYAFTITYDPATWQIDGQPIFTEGGAGNPVEQLYLTSVASDNTFVAFVAQTQPAWEDAADCVAGLRDEVAGFAGVENFVERGEITGDAGDALLVVDYAYLDVEWTDTLRCQAIAEGESYLSTWYQAPAAIYETDGATREALLEGVAVGATAEGSG